MRVITNEYLRSGNMIRKENEACPGASHFVHHKFHTNCPDIVFNAKFVEKF
jgi:hypothetical protein